MISFVQMCQDLPYVEFRSYYEKALKANQKNIEAIAISSFSKDNNFVDSRFVNLKFINEKEFIFFSNYNSPKSKQFETHPQISALLFWSEINIQIRIIANIKERIPRLIIIILGIEVRKKCISNFIPSIYRNRFLSGYQK